jgi:hypothetical protein
MNDETLIFELSAGYKWTGYLECSFIDLKYNGWLMFSENNVIFLKNTNRILKVPIINIRNKITGQKIPIDVIFNQWRLMYE